MATLATSGFLPRSVKLRHRLLRCRLPACPRARSAGSTLAQRARSVGPDVLGRAVLPGRFDQQAHMGVAGLGDRPLHAGVARGVFGGHQADVGADRGPGEARPATDLHGQRQPVSAEMPRQQPSRLTGSANRGEAATTMICSSRRSRAAVAANTASKP